MSVLNQTEIVIMGGNDGSWLNDIFVLNTETAKCAKVGQGGPFAFLSYSNSAASYTENKIVALVLDNSSKPQFIEYGKGMSRISVLKELPKYWQ